LIATTGFASITGSVKINIIPSQVGQVIFLKIQLRLSHQKKIYIYIMYSFICNYAGNKYKELSKFFNQNPEIVEKIKQHGFKKIVECYGGSYGFIRCLNHVYNLEGIEYEVYDINKNLIELYWYIQKLDIEEYKKFIDDYNKKITYIKQNLEYINGKTYFNKTTLLAFLKKMNFDNKHQEYLIYNNLARGAFCTANHKTFEEKDFYLIKKIKFTLGSCLVVEDDESLFYFDPPYLFSPKIEYYSCDFIVDKHNINETIKTLVNSSNKINFIFNHEENFLLDVVFRECDKFNYGKIYGCSKKRSLTSFFIFLKKS